jgi:hypothetical protein
LRTTLGLNFFFCILGIVAKPSQEDRHKVDINLGKQPKVEDQHNVDAKPTKEPHIRLISASNSQRKGSLMHGKR